MGFHVEINSILRSDDFGGLRQGEVHQFKKSGSRIFFDDIPVWLTRSDWTALAEIYVLSQTRTNGDLTGTFQVLHVYSAAEQEAMTAVFRRMYAETSNRFVYLLMSEATLAEAKSSGTFAPESLKTEGFIHASPSNQLTRVANKYYATGDKVFVLVCDMMKIKSPVIWEPATGGLYPHIYGPFNMDAVKDTRSFSIDSDGAFDISI